MIMGVFFFVVVLDGFWQWGTNAGWMRTVGPEQIAKY
jgi:hypothetical protein